MIYTVSKKIIQLFLIVIFLSINISIGDSTGNQTISGSTQITVPFPTLNEERNKLNYIDVRFCNDGVEEEKLTDILSIIVRPGQEKEICIIIFNRDNEDIYLWGGFSTNEIAPNGNNNCGTNYEWDNAFSKFIKPFEERSITVPAKGSIVKKTTIKFPIGVNGLQKGCFAFGTTPGKLDEGQIFAFVLRKIQLINVFIEGNPYTKIENLRDILIKNKSIIFSILFIIVLTLLVLEIKKYKKQKK